MPEQGRAFQLSVSVDWADIIRWQDQALCHGMEDVFDFRRFSGEIGDSDKTTRAELREEVREKKRLAEPICFSCPVFNECWFDAYARLPVSVFQAGAALTSGAEEQRRLRLEEALIKQQNWYRNKKVAEWRKRRADSFRDSEAG